MLIPNALMSIVFGAISAYVAKSRGKNPFLWFGLGALFGLFGLLFLLFAPQMKTQKGARKSPLDKNTIDITPPFDPKYNEKFWYYVDQSNKTQGPMSFDGLYRLFQDKAVSLQTFVWNESLDSWKPLNEFLS